MASVPNLPIAPAVPIPGATGLPDAEGAGLDVFAQLLTGGPAIAVIAGQVGPPAGEVTLRAVPGEADGESAEGHSGEDDAAQPDIIPLLQAQSGFPVALVPALAATPPAPPAPVEAAPAAVPVVASVAAQPASVPQPAPAAKASAPATPPVAPQGDDAPPAEPIGDAVKAAIEKIAGKPAPRAAKVAPSVPAQGEQGKPAEPAPQTGQMHQSEPVATRIETAAQPAVRIPVAFAPEPAAPQSNATAAPASAAPNVANLVAERQLDLANDNRWLDRLARDIARSGAGDEPLRFRLHPQTLGHLQVELTQSERGATVRLTVETEAARNILIDAQPRLAAEARAQGVRLAGTEVDLGAAGQQGGDARRNADPQPQNVVRVVRASSEPTNGEPAAGRSDRYA